MTAQVRLDVGHGAAAVRAARHGVRATLAGAVDDVVLDTAVLLVSELVTNATLHAGGPVQVVLDLRPGVLRIEVHDQGTRLPAPRRALGRDRLSGRGLHLVSELALRWGADPRPDGKVVWCELATVAPAGA